MVNRSKAKGTAWETAVVQYLNRRGWIYAERRALSGNLDKGDVAGIPGLVLECKSAKTIDLAGWLTETAAEQKNANAALGVVVAKRRGKADPGEGYAVLPFRQLCDLLAAAGYRGSSPTPDEEAA